MKRNAFTLIEVIIAIGMLTVAVSVVASLQLRSLFRVLRDRDMIEKIFLIKKDVYAMWLKPPAKQFKKINKLEDKEMAIATVVSGINPKSSLASLGDRLQMVCVTGAWKQNQIKQRVAMGAVIFKPYQSDKEKQ